MRRIRIEHTTQYEYREPVEFLKHRLLIRPRVGHDIRIESSRLEIQPAYTIRWYRDVYGNSVATVEFTERSDKLVITSEVVVQHYEESPTKLVLAEAAEQFPLQYDAMEQVDLTIYLLSAYPRDSAQIGQWLRELWKPGGNIATAELLESINQKIVDDIEYEVRESVGVQAPAETLRRKRGSCRDVATLFIEACRFCGVAARFVSGYLLSSSAVRDVASTHAWSEVYLPASGWRGFDSTSGQLVGGEHVAVAVHRHPEAISPVSGSYVGPAKPPPVMTVEVRATEL